MPKEIKEENSNESDVPQCRTQPTLEGIDLTDFFSGDLFGNSNNQNVNPELVWVPDDVPSLSNINSGGFLNLFSFVESVEPDQNTTTTSLPRDSGSMFPQESDNLHPQDPVPCLFKAICTANSNNSKCGTYSFSSLLNKLYVNMNVGIAFNFKLNPFIPGVIVRTTAIYQKHVGISEPVVRCEEHRSPEHALNEGFLFPLHFIRCSSTGTWYEVDEVGGFHSVCTPLPDNTNGCVPLIYRFMCRTSCIFKSSITMRFELMLNNEVLATDLLDVRVCACPTRDRMNEEKSKQTVKPKRKCVEVFKVRSSTTASAGRLLSSHMIPAKKPRC